MFGAQTKNASTLVVLFTEKKKGFAFVKKLRKAIDWRVCQCQMLLLFYKYRAWPLEADSVSVLLLEGDL